MSRGLLHWAGLALGLWFVLAATSPASAAEREKRQGRAGQSRSKAGRASKNGPKGTSKSSPKPAHEAEATDTDDSDALGGLDDESPPPPPPPPPKPVAVQEVTPPAPSSDEDETDSTAEASASDDAVSDSEAPAPETAEAESGPSIVIRPFGGVGIATRQNRIPTTEGAREISPKVVPAVEVGLQVVAWPEAAFSLGFNLVYQSAVGYAVTERAPFALDKEVRARSERVALDVAPTWRFGNLQLAVALGVSIRTLWPEVHMSLTQGYSLVGPHARVELNLPLGGALALRLSPEAQAILSIDEELRQAGVSSVGVALGGDAGLELRLSQVWQVEINYRESHALLSSTRGASFLDVERYLTLRLIGSF